MKKYLYCMTANDVWFNAAVELHKKNIAKPVLWLGDGRHYKKAKEIFGEDVLSMDDFVHYQTNIKDINYDAENIEFLKSENYLRAKDRCLKMMDRLDVYGTFGRIDRETIFNKLSIWFLKKIENCKPEAMVVAEMPHSHAQYLLLEICLFLDLEIVKFNTMLPAPLLFLQNVKTNKRQKRVIPFHKEISDIANKDIQNYVNAILEKNNLYELPYMRTQRIQSKPLYKITNFFKYGLVSKLKEIIFQFRKLNSKDYYHINPYGIGVYGRSKIKKVRIKNLLKHLNHNLDDIDLTRKFVYFALHFEPERTTNPDGGIFHEQALAIITLRKFLPNDIEIFVKEHPTQFYIKERGSIGRSPLFYEFIRNINGVKLVPHKFNSLELINKSVFTSTISGSVALEAAILNKKALIFGDTWFNGCPNVYLWNEDLKFKYFTESHLRHPNEILKFLLNEKDKYSIPGCLNNSAQLRFASYLGKKFNEAEFRGVVHLLEEFFKSLDAKNLKK